MSQIETGLYRHYKGAEYEVLGLVKHSETEEELVVYRALYGEFGLWVRPLAMFKETVLIENESVQRFQLLKAYPIKLGNYPS
jgi:hypothetical protein